MPADANIIGDGRGYPWASVRRGGLPARRRLQRMSAGTLIAGPQGDHSIQLRLKEISQLFNSLDPSPFTEQDLDQDAEEFIVSWARELPRRRPLHLIVHVERPMPPGREPAGVTAAIHHYFLYRASIARLELRHLFNQGQTSLIIGTAFLTACLLLSRLIGARENGAGWSVAQEGLTIGGWVAMWRPMETYLYDWWPLWRRVALLQRLGRMKVDLRLPKEGAPVAPADPRTR
jgi:hypothetical protein